MDGGVLHRADKIVVAVPFLEVPVAGAADSAEIQTVSDVHPI
jgi:hypothetical protein